MSTLADDSPDTQAAPSLREQVCTYPASAADIISTQAFACGLEEVRLGLPFNPNNDSWGYERGRAFGFIAPATLPLRIGTQLNRKALKLAEAAFIRRLLI
jgi:hypothetical protein